MFSWLAKIAFACWGPIKRYASMGRGDGTWNSLVWSRNLEKHAFGDFSFAVAQANDIIEDHSQVETNQDIVFVGVYDGHGGPDASVFIADNLFLNFIRLARDRKTVSEEILKNAISETEDGFLNLVRTARGINPLIAAIGSCCLVGVIWRGKLYVANLGDSRAIIGCSCGSDQIIAEQLTMDHNARFEEIRQELKCLHPDDPHIVEKKHGAWRVKGIIQISRSIGDAYLKNREFSIDPSYPRFHLPEPIKKPAISSDPSICSRVLQPNDHFLIFASDGLWDNITNQEAVEIVFKNPRSGIAKRLAKVALDVAARKKEMRYDDLKTLREGIRRFFHDDITVVVVFIDHQLLERHSSSTLLNLSVRGLADTDES